MMNMKFFFLSIVLFFLFLNEGYCGVADSLKKCGLKNVNSKKQQLKSSISKKSLKSDLSLENIYIKGSTLWISIKNNGNSGLSQEDYTNGKLLLRVTELNSGKTKVYSFPIKQLDPRKILSHPQSKLTFNTKINCSGKVNIKAELKNLKHDEKRGVKILSKTILPPALYIGKVTKDKAIQDKSISRSKMEEELEKEKANLMQDIPTLEEAKGKRACDVQKEDRIGTYEGRDFKFSKDNKVNLKEGILGGDSFYGPESPEFGDWREVMDYMTEGSGVPGEGNRGHAPHRAYSWEEFKQDLKAAFKAFINFVNTAGLPTYDPYNVEWYAEALAKCYDDRIPPEHRGCTPKWPLGDKEDKNSGGEEYVSPEKIGYRNLPIPWAPHRKGIVQRRDEATDIERKPHLVDFYHYKYEEWKKGSSSSGYQVNPGSLSDQGYRYRYHAGWETLWRLRTWATDPDFPGTATKAEVKGIN
jgi:hypothetical protein